MKKIFNFMMFACIMMLAASCSSDDDGIIEESEPSVFGDEVVIGVGMPDDEDTRVAINDLELAWEEGDKLAILGFDGSGKYIAESDFTIQTGAGSKSATFKGNEIINAVKYKVVYKSANLNVQKDGTYSMDYFKSEQTEMGNNAHLRENILLSNDEVSELKGNVKLDLKNSFLRINIKSLPIGLDYTNIIKWFVNYGSENEVLQGTLKFNGSLKGDADNYLYMPFTVKSNLEPGGVMAFTFLSSSVYRVVSGKSNGGKTYKPGMRYNVTIAKDDTTPKSLNNWDYPIDSPYPSELWCKYTSDVKPLSQRAVNNVTMKLVNTEPNKEGWYMYRAAEKIESSTSAFVNDTKVTEVWLPGTLKEISYQTFSGCSNLKRIIFAGDITTIGTSAFFNCSSLEDLTIPASVTSVGSQAIANTSSLKRLVICCKTINSGILFGTQSTFNNCILYINKSLESKVTGLSFDGYSFKKIYFIDDDGNIVK